MLPPSRFLLALVAFLSSALGLALAQGGGTVARTAAGYKHKETKTELALGKDWKDLGLKSTFNFTALGLTHHKLKKCEVTIYWKSLDGLDWDKAVEAERFAQQTLYGKDKVGAPEVIKIGERLLTRMSIADGLARDGKETGVVYLTQLGANKDFRLKIRGAFLKEDHDAGVQALEELLKGLKDEK